MHADVSGYPPLGFPVFPQQLRMSRINRISHSGYKSVSHICSQTFVACVCACLCTCLLCVLPCFILLSNVFDEKVDYIRTTSSQY